MKLRLKLVIKARRKLLVAAATVSLVSCADHYVPGPNVQGTTDLEVAKAPCRLMAESGGQLVAGFGQGLSMAMAMAMAMAEDHKTRGLFGNSGLR